MKIVLPHEIPKKEPEHQFKSRTKFKSLNRRFKNESRKEVYLTFNFKLKK